MKNQSKTWLIVVSVILSVILIYHFFSGRGRGNIYVRDSQLFQDSVVSVHIKDLVDTSAVKVFVNGQEGKKISLSNEDLLIKVPDILDTTAQEDVPVILSVEDNHWARLYTMPITYTKHITVKGTPSVLYENSTINITGKNLNLPGLTVSINGNQSRIISQQFSRSTITVPELTDTTTGQFINFAVTRKGASLFEKKWTFIASRNL